MRTGMLLTLLAACLATATVAGAKPEIQVLRGTFVTTISGKGRFLNGSWALRLDPPMFETRRNGKVVVRGLAAASRGRLALTDVSGPYACRGIEKAAVYTYTLKRGKLTLKAIVDRCDGRRILLTTHALTRA